MVVVNDATIVYHPKFLSMAKDIEISFYSPRISSLLHFSLSTPTHTACFTNVNDTIRYNKDVLSLLKKKISRKTPLKRKSEISSKVREIEHSSYFMKKEQKQRMHVIYWEF